MITEPSEAIQDLAFKADAMGDDFDPGMAVNLLARDVKNLLSVQKLLIYMDHNGYHDSFYEYLMEVYTEGMAPAMFDMISKVLIADGDEEDLMYFQGPKWGVDGPYFQGIAALEGVASMLRWNFSEYRNKTKNFMGATLLNSMEINEFGNGSHTCAMFYKIKNTWAMDCKNCLDMLPSNAPIGVGSNELKNALFQMVFDAYATAVYGGEKNPGSYPLRGMGYYTFRLLASEAALSYRGQPSNIIDDQVLVIASALSMGFLGRPIGYRPDKSVQEKAFYKKIVSEGRKHATSLRSTQHVVQFEAITAAIRGL